MFKIAVRIVLGALSIGLAGCGSANYEPLALQKVQPSVDENGEIHLLADEAGEPVTFLQAILKQGIPTKIAKAALLKYDRFQAQIGRTEYLVMIDFTQHSSKKRLYMINRATGVVDSLPVAHGERSDPTDSGYANYFSNLPDSHMSSLGAYLIQEKYQGKYGSSMKLDGLERSNSNVRDRVIVVHPAPYVKEDGRRPGRSWGCTAIPQIWMKKALERLAGGSFMYAYGVNKRDASGDDYWVQKWNLTPKAQWTNESEDAPFDGE